MPSSPARSTLPASRRLPPRLLLLAALACLTPTAHAQGGAQLIDDRAVTLRTPRDVLGRRRILIQYLFGAEGFPAQRLPDVVIRDVFTPVLHLDRLARVDELRFDQEHGLEGLAYHFIPQQPNHELVIVHHGHACTLNDSPSPADVGYGMQRTIDALLREGYGVLGVFMPHMRPGDCTNRHNAMFRLQTTGSPMKYFLEPVAAGVNYLASAGALDDFPRYTEFHMLGLSGGGWTTVVYAAIDPRIRCSVQIAGSLPLYLRSGGSIGDREQWESTFYSLAGYPDLYVLGGIGKGRSQVQLLVRRDDCCFGERQHDPVATGLSYDDALREYEGRVQQALAGIGPGSFRIEIDEVAPGHMISHHALADVILPELRRAK